MAKKHKVKAIHEQVFEEGQWFYRVEWAGHNSKGYSWEHTWQLEEDLGDCSVFQTWKSQHPNTNIEKDSLGDAKVECKDGAKMTRPCFVETKRKCESPSPHSSRSSSFSASSIERKCSPADSEEPESKDPLS